MLQKNNDIWLIGLDPWTPIYYPKSIFESELIKKQIIRKESFRGTIRK